MVFAILFIFICSSGMNIANKNNTKNDKMKIKRNFDKMLIKTKKTPVIAMQIR